MKDKIEKCITQKGKLNPNIFSNLNITRKEAYNIYYNESEKCDRCGNNKSFISFSKGYKDCVCLPINTKITKDIIHKNVKNGKLNKKVFASINITEKELFDIYRPNEDRCICGKVKEFISFYRGYKRTCNDSMCINKIGEEKRIKTNLEKYGVRHTSQVKSNRGKASKSYQENIEQNRINAKKGQEKVDQKAKHEKIKKTKLKRYNDEHYNNNKKCIETVQSLYGISCVLTKHNTGGLGSSAYKHIKNIDDYNKEGFSKFILENNHFDFKKCSKYFNITRDTINKLLIRFDIKIDRDIGHNYNDPWKLYYIRINPTGEYKIGITKNTIKERFNKEYENIEVIRVWKYENGYEALHNEQLIRKEFKYALSPNNYFTNKKNQEIFKYDVLGLDSNFYRIK